MSREGDDIDIDKWVMEHELEEEYTDPHYSLYYTPEHDDFTY